MGELINDGDFVSSGEHINGGAEIREIAEGEAGGHGGNVYAAATSAQIAAAPQLRQALARGAAELHTHFSWPEIAAATLEVLQDVAAR